MKHFAIIITIAQSARAVEYTDCISAEGQHPLLHQVSVLDNDTWRSHCPNMQDKIITTLTSLAAQLVSS